jgi:3-dehydroquinate dehydratase / shikimate dehydrogenase
MTMICVPIMVEEANTALLDASLAQAKGAELVEYRVDLLFEQRDEESLEERTSRVLELVEESPLPCIVTCRPHWEGGEYQGDDDERISLYIALGTSDHPPAYIDVELATYTRSANIKEKINLAVGYKKLNKLFGRRTSTRLILSSHDFEGRPADLTRRIIAMNNEPACSVVKIAYRARSIRDNLELFEILRDRQKPTIALGMGEFGTMSRILAPKFGGLLTFASLRSESTTAPGQPTIDELLNLYRFRSIKSSTKVYGIIGWPITQSMSPLVHNAGFEAIGFDAVYVPMPVAADTNDAEASQTSFDVTISQMIEDKPLVFCGASVTIPHKEHAANLAIAGLLNDSNRDDPVMRIGAANTITQWWSEIEHDHRICDGISLVNSDALAIHDLLQHTLGDLNGKKIALVGAGGVSKAAASCAARDGANVIVSNRTFSRAQELTEQLLSNSEDGYLGTVQAMNIEKLPSLIAEAFINCTPVGMTGGSDPDGLSIPIPDMPPLPPETVFFDTVYNPIETPMLKAAKERGYRTIDGVQMFVKQAEAQFELWTGQSAPEGLFDRLVREKLSENSSE